MWNNIKYYDSPSHYMSINDTVTLAQFFLIAIAGRSVV